MWDAGEWEHADMLCGNHFRVCLHAKYMSTSASRHLTYQRSAEFNLEHGQAGSVWGVKTEGLAMDPTRADGLMGRWTGNISNAMR